jgi:hypothetical protein
MPTDSPVEPVVLRPSCLCRIIGHSWFNRVERQGVPSLGYTTIQTFERPTCRRCGAKNPSYSVA